MNQLSKVVFATEILNEDLVFMHYLSSIKVVRTKKGISIS